jgi:peroxiredoxin
MKFNKIITGLVVLLCAGLYANPSDSTATLRVNDTLPEVTLKTMEGKPFALREQLKGKPIVLMFYRANWCPYCNAQLSDMQDIEKPLMRLGYKLVAISPETPAQQIETSDKNFLKMLMLSDAAKIAMNVYGISNGSVPHPTVIVTDANHVIKYIYSDKDYTKRVSADTVYEIAEKNAGK